ncbi:MAG: hypothetical protein H0T94_03525 [Acidimicrobiia bacterium]|nr:hypothetical protein [Acidimicrobiia bacterium]
MRRSPAKWAFPLVAGFEIWILQELRFTGFPIWSEVGAALMYSVLVLGPVAAGLAGLRAWVERRPALVDLDTGMVREAAVRRWLATAGEIGWVALAFLTGVLFLMAAVGPGATWGEPDWMLVAAAFLAVWACGFIGWSVSWLLPSRVTGPLVGLALYMAMGLSVSLDLTVGASWIPSSLERLTPFEVSRPGLRVAQVAIFGGFILAGVAASAIGVRSRRAILGLVVGLTLVVAGLVVAPVGRPAVAAIDPPQVCDPGVVTVCYHPAYSTGAQPVIVAVRRTMAPLLTAGVVPSRLAQYEYEEPAGVSVPFLMDPDPNEASRAVARAALAGAVGAGVCEDFEDRYRVWTVVEAWLISQAGYEAGQLVFDQTGQSHRLDPFFDPDHQAMYQRFVAVPDDDRIVWLAGHFDRLRSCDVGTEELP